MKKVAIFVLALCLIMPATLYAAEINVVIDDEVVHFADQGPTIVNGRTMVPVRGVFEALNFRVGWYQPTMTATLTRDDFIVIITVGSNVFTTNGERFGLDVPAQIIEGRTMLPIRAVLQSIGYEVGWDGNTSTVIITSTPRPTPVPAPMPMSTPAPARTHIFTSPTEEGSRFEQRVLELVNIERTRHGLFPVVWDDTLAGVARDHSRDMAINGFSGHIGPDGSNVSDRLHRVGIAYLMWAENVSVGRRSADAAMSAWMDSPGHRANILRPEVTHIGVGFYQLDGSQGRFYATQKFIQAVN